MRITAALLGVLLLAGTGLAQGWSVTTADFQRLEGELKAVDDAGLHVQSAAAERTLPWAQVVSAEQPGARLTLGGDPFVLVTRDGQRIVGTLSRFADEKLSWRNQLLGVLDLPIEEVAGIVQLPSETLPASAGHDDLIVLANGDQLRGIIEADPEGGFVIQQGEKSAKVPWDSVKAVVLAQVGGVSRTEPAGQLRIRLTDGSACLASKLHRDGDQLHIQRSAGELKLPLSTIVSIANEGGKVRFLAHLEPKEQRYAPYLQVGDQAPVARKVLEEVVVNGRTYRSVIQIRPRAVLSYSAPVEGKLHLRYACASPGEMTDMAVRVLVEGKPIHEKQGVTSASATEAVESAVANGATVTIELDYGRNFDVQDHLLLLEAAFVAK